MGHASPNPACTAAGSAAVTKPAAAVARRANSASGQRFCIQLDAANLMADLAADHLDFSAEAGSDALNSPETAHRLPVVQRFRFNSMLLPRATARKGQAFPRLVVRGTPILQQARDGLFR